MAVNPTGYSNPECYAQSLGDCRGQVTREHVVSEGVLKLVYGRAGEINKQVLVRGLSFQPPDVVEERGISRLVAKMLCEGHNHYLSRRFDPAGQAMFRAMDALNDAAGDPAALQQMFRVDGDDLERWMLKTFINGLFSGLFRPAPGETLKKEYPLLEWLQILFKDAEFPKGCGLYWLAGTVGAVFTADEEVLQFEPRFASKAPKSSAGCASASSASTSPWRWGGCSRESLGRSRVSTIVPQACGRSRATPGSSSTGRILRAKRYSCRPCLAQPAGRRGPLRRVRCRVADRPRGPSDD
jgi:hypothetical protein